MSHGTLTSLYVRKITPQSGGEVGGGGRKGVLTQTVGPWQCPVAYLSKPLDPVAEGWPLCLWALAVAVVWVREADKLNLGQNINVNVPHAVTALMNSQGHK